VHKPIPDCKTAWFEDWFASPYYSILYAHRDEQEAEVFLQKFISSFPPNPDSKIWDLACGNGRHTRLLSRMGYEVTGTDLSAPFIRYALSHKNAKETFLLQDMRAPAPGHDFNFVFNLFTAFGYFDSEDDDLLVLERVNEGLVSGGYFVLDYLNFNVTLNNLVTQETKTMDTIDFSIRKYIRDGRLYKDITVSDKGISHHYLESIKILYLQDFEALLKQCGFTLRAIWGEYTGQTFKASESSRLILIAQKN